MDGLIVEYLCIATLGITVRVDLISPAGSLSVPGILSDLIIFLKVHKITQRELALAAGVDESFVSRALMGERRFTSYRIKRIRDQFPNMPTRLFKLAA